MRFKSKFFLIFFAMFFVFNNVYSEGDIFTDTTQYNTDNVPFKDQEQFKSYLTAWDIKIPEGQKFNVKNYNKDSGELTVTGKEGTEIKFKPHEIEGATINSDGSVVLKSTPSDSGITITGGEIKKSSTENQFEITGGSITTSEGKTVTSSNSFKLTSTSSGIKFGGDDITIHGIGVLKKGSVTILKKDEYGENSFMLGSATTFEKKIPSGDDEMLIETKNPVAYVTKSCGSAKSCILDTSAKIEVFHNPDSGNPNNLVIKNLNRKGVTFNGGKIEDSSKVSFYPKYEDKGVNNNARYDFTKDNILQYNVEGNLHIGVNVVGYFLNQQTNKYDGAVFVSKKDSVAHTYIPSSIKNSKEIINFLTLPTDHFKKISQGEQSIVDALNKLEINSDIEFRKELYQVLMKTNQVPGDSAKMNIDLLNVIKNIEKDVPFSSSLASPRITTRSINHLPGVQQATIVNIQNKVIPVASEKINSGRYTHEINKLYDALAFVETGKESDPWIRTKMARDSSAFGEVQITGTLAKLYLKNERTNKLLRPEVKDWMNDRFIPQSKLFLNNQRGDYALGGKGDGFTDDDKKLYKEMALVMIEQEYRAGGGTIEGLSKRWLGSTNEAYVNGVKTYYLSGRNRNTEKS